MKIHPRMQLAVGALAGALLMQAELFAEAPARVPAAVAAPGEEMVATFHAEGAQLYECKPDANKKLVWERQIGSLQKRAPLLLEKMSRVMDDPQNPPPENMRAGIVKALQGVQAAMERLQAAKMS